MQSYKLYICERHVTPDQIYIYPICKMLKEVPLPTLNLPQKSASSATKPRHSNAIEKREECTNFFKKKCPNPYTMLINRSRISHHESRALHLQKVESLKSRNS